MNFSKQNRRPGKWKSRKKTPGQGHPQDHVQNLDQGQDQGQGQGLSQGHLGDHQQDHPQEDEGTEAITVEAEVAPGKMICSLFYQVGLY